MNALTGQDEVIGRLCGVHIRDENGVVLYSLTDIRNGEVFGRIPADETHRESAISGWAWGFSKTGQQQATKVRCCSGWSE